jgi:TRAP-type mannitol/chloroaromatic compound transport system permease small subunit
MTAFLHFIDSLSTWVGRAFAWLILILTFAMSYEVFVRYALSAPTTWAFDFSYILYGALFLMSGAYTLAHNSHVRGDFMYRKWRPRVQATIDLVLYFLFFLPGIIALIYAGTPYALRSIAQGEVSIFSPAGIPVFPLKALIPLAGALLLIQGFAEIVRCIICLRQGYWPQRLKDVEEMETVILHEQQFLREHGEAEAPGAKGKGA